ncbi:hypothetical protein [Yoonia sediminilitoris]|uniref:Uncharacterized protein n=1 Tax=Yoonia sediminilitoris TaxID=1286148 RepID=A0A2T6K7F7_9RHOB|nr:hypothetical protein [Yoonia sediminilitoris]PUB10658.1 hypothetical protein C8N45_1171 [Yoonia sediminilitoris]RCW90410.1 hypothetical protein DFP92_1171 [Yoonia sediminilitoris]
MSEQNYRSKARSVRDEARATLAALRQERIDKRRIGKIARSTHTVTDPPDGSLDDATDLNAVEGFANAHMRPAKRNATTKPDVAFYPEQDDGARQACDQKNVAPHPLTDLGDEIDIAFEGGAEPFIIKEGFSGKDIAPETEPPGCGTEGSGGRAAEVLLPADDTAQQEADTAHDTGHVVLVESDAGNGDATGYDENPDSVSDQHRKGYPDSSGADAVVGRDAGDQTPEQGESRGEQETVSEQASTNLYQLPGAGAGLIWMLSECGIHSLEDLAQTDVASLTKCLGLVGQILDVKVWVEFAQSKEVSSGA